MPLPIRQTAARYIFHVHDHPRTPERKGPDLSGASRPQGCGGPVARQRHRSLCLPGNL